MQVTCAGSATDYLHLNNYNVKLFTYYLWLRPLWLGSDKFIKFQALLAIVMQPLKGMTSWRLNQQLLPELMQDGQDISLSTSLRYKRQEDCLGFGIIFFVWLSVIWWQEWCPLFRIVKCIKYYKLQLLVNTQQIRKWSGAGAGPPNPEATHGMCFQVVLYLTKIHTSTLIIQNQILKLLFEPAMVSLVLLSYSQNWPWFLQFY